MSVKLMTQAWETEQKGNDLLVLLALCDFASDEGVAFPSLDTLGKKAKVGKTTLSYILRAYEEIGIITRTQRKRENKSDTSTLYKINHFSIDVDKYKKAYQEARKYVKKSQCEHPKKNHNVNTHFKNVNTQNANCEHLEPSSINHQDINHQRKNTKKENQTKPKEILEFYKKNISDKNFKLQEQSSYTQLALRKDELDLIYKGLINYAKALPDDRTYIKALPNFIKDKIYLDYQEEIKNITSMPNSNRQTKREKTNQFIDDYFLQKQSNTDVVEGELIS